MKLRFDLASDLVRKWRELTHHHTQRTDDFDLDWANDCFFFSMLLDSTIPILLCVVCQTSGNEKRNSFARIATSGRCSQALHASSTNFERNRAPATWWRDRAKGQCKPPTIVIFAHHSFCSCQTRKTKTKIQSYSESATESDLQSV